MRRHLNYANVVATLALVFAMSGGAIAAKHYLVNSTSQINPKVLKKLKAGAGKPGARGAAGSSGAPGEKGTIGSVGPAGSAGKAGDRGPEGLEGPEGEEGPSGIGPAFATFHDGEIEVTSTEESKSTVVATLNVPAGDYAIFGKLYVSSNKAGTTSVFCRLAAATDTDDDLTHIELGETEAEALQVVHTFAGAGLVRIGCWGVTEEVSISHIKITAIQVSALTDTAS
ncbi:MAG TPA: collagen-like protein [Solirubrobacteraceae bacterium]|jgi:hypothetical protein|nr:collagen-like protein [Solirubrobacteraceae bacterium]